MAKSIDLESTAEASYARTLVARGCPEALAANAARILAHEDSPSHRSRSDEKVVALAYAQIR